MSSHDSQILGIHHVTAIADRTTFVAGDGAGTRVDLVPAAGRGRVAAGARDRPARGPGRVMTGPHQGQRTLAAGAEPVAAARAMILLHGRGAPAERFYPGMPHTVNEDELEHARRLTAAVS